VADTHCVFVRRYSLLKRESYIRAPHTQLAPGAAGDGAGVGAGALAAAGLFEVEVSLVEAAGGAGPGADASDEAGASGGAGAAGAATGVALIQAAWREREALNFSRLSLHADAVLSALPPATRGGRGGRGGRGRLGGQDGGRQRVPEPPLWWAAARAAAQWARAQWARAAAEAAPPWSALSELAEALAAAAARALPAALRGAARWLPETPHGGGAGGAGAGQGAGGSGSSALVHLVGLTAGKVVAHINPSGGEKGGGDAAGQPEPMAVEGALGPLAPWKAGEAGEGESGVGEASGLFGDPWSHSAGRAGGQGWEGSEHHGYVMQVGLPAPTRHQFFALRSATVCHGTYLSLCVRSATVCH